MIRRVTSLLATALVVLAPGAARAAATDARTAPVAAAAGPWSFQPLRPVALPKIHDRHWPQTRIDYFLLAKMEAAGFKPAAASPAPALVRRLYFDVIGLPPSPAETEHWSAELSRGGGLNRAALARLVDELLASPRYGER